MFLALVDLQCWFVRVIVALLALVLASPLSGVGAVSHLCPLVGAMDRDCPCEAARASSNEGANATVAPASCCDVVRNTTVPAPPAAHNDAASRTGAPQFVVVAVRVVIWAAPPADRLRPMAPVDASPPGPVDPVYLRTQSLLI